MEFPSLNFVNLPPGSNNETGQLTITGLDPSISFEFLSKIWAQVRKRVRKNYGVGVVATFKRNDKNEVICTFLRNGAYASYHNIDKRIYKSRFEDTFQFWIADFEDILEKASIDLFQGMSEEETIHSCFPEKQIQKKRKARKIAKKSAKNNHVDIQKG